jgi:hypothetical protein
LARRWTSAPPRRWQTPPSAFQRCRQRRHGVAGPRGHGARTQHRREMRVVQPCSVKVVLGTAGQGQLVDVGGVGCGPRCAVVDFGEVTRYVAARCAAAAISGKNAEVMHRSQVSANCLRQARYRHIMQHGTSARGHPMKLAAVAFMTAVTICAPPLSTTASAAAAPSTPSGCYPQTKRATATSRAKCVVRATMEHLG